jgi:flagellar biosynthesis/type III secretory pathway chaperone
VSAEHTDIAGRAHTLDAQVRALTAALEAMLIKLGAEREALRAHAKVDVLEHIVRDKQGSVEHIGALYAELRRALVAFGDERGNMREHIAAVRAIHPELAQRVDRLEALTRECQQANHDIGLLVSVGLRNANGALDTLHGVSTAAAANTYDTNGRAERDSGSEFLAIRA